MHKFLSNLNFINPVVRKVGIQSNEWGKNRKIYDYELMFCVSGHAKLHYNNQIIDIIENTLLLIMPNKAHTFEMIDNSSLIYWVHFDFFQFLDVSDLDKYVSNNNNDLYLDQLIKTKYIRPTISQLENTPSSIIFEKNESIKVAKYFSRIKNLYDDESPMWQLETKSYIILILVKYFDKVNIMKEAKSTMTGEFVYSVVSSYILQNIQKKMTIEDVTKNIPYCHDYANKLFKKSSGMSISDYINQAKIDATKKYLLTDELSISDIAQSLGFTSQHYFSRFIKNQTGMTPSQLKKQLVK